MNEQNQSEKASWRLNLLCIVSTVASSYFGLGGLLFLIFWGALLLGVFTKSRRIRYAAFCSAASAFLTVWWVLR